MDGPINVMYRGAGAIARRVLGADTPRYRRVVFHWASEVPVADRPFPIFKDGRTICSWEHDIAAAGGRGSEHEEFPGSGKRKASAKTSPS
jgi:hypothetical protein